MTRKHLCFFLILIMITGCMAPQKKITSELSSSMRRIIIVPIEPPPLAIGPPILSVLGGVPVISAYPPEGAAVLYLIAGIVALTRTPKHEQKRADILNVLEEWYKNDQTWIPTIALAQEAADQISKANTFEVIVRRELHTLSSVEKREASWHMENWYAPLREWYNQNTSAIDIEEHGRQNADAMLEIGILNFEIFQGHLLLQVFTRLVSVSSGEVLARSRYITTNPPPIGQPDELFKNQGEKFKQMFLIEGRKQLNHNLNKIGLLT